MFLDTNGSRVVAAGNARTLANGAARIYAGYLTVSSGNCKAWTRSAVTNEIADWNGECDDLGFISGKGRLDLYDAEGVPIESYAGTFVVGALDGFGSWTSGNGSYRGDFRDGKKDGKGEQILDGDHYVGRFREDQKSGQGAAVWKNGDRYRGRWLNDWPDGYGEAVISGVVVSGQWRKGCLLADPSMGAGRPSEACTKILPGLTVYSSEELVLMRWQQEQGLSPWGCQPPKGQSGPGILLCD
jgi:hypothetical protein